MSGSPPATKPATRKPTLGGPAGAAPPAWVPLSFLAASGFGLVLFGIAGTFGSSHVEAPTHPGMVAAVHSAMLGFLTMGVLGALHQFGPVVGNRALRSTRLAAVTLALLFPGIWTLAGGFAHGPSWLVPAGGITATVAILLAAWNLSAPLSGRGKGVPLMGLRLSVAYLVVTVGFGVIYALDRNYGWFPLLTHRVLAHAHLGLLGWLGLSYVSVAEKLWPMFLLAHRPGARSGAVAVSALGGGVPVLVLGLLFDVRAITTIGAALAIVGLAAHLVSLVGTIRARRRRLELLHGFIVVSAAFLVGAIVLGVVGGLASISSEWRMRMVASEVLCLAAWLGLALLGHSHKVVPFIAWTKLRTSGRMPSGGPPLLFGDLYREPFARLTLGLSAVGFAAALIGMLSNTAVAFAAGSIALGLSGAVTLWNLGTGPRAALQRRAKAASAVSAG